MNTTKVLNVSVLARVRQCLVEAAKLTDILPVADLQALRQRADSNSFNLVVVGEFKRGKSSILNALIGADILPVGVVPLTAIATILQHGAEAQVTVMFLDGTKQTFEQSALWDYATEKGNPGNEKAVAEVHISLPSPWLERGVRLVDTPGIGSIYQHNSDTTHNFLPKADAVLFVLSVDQPVGQAEYDFLQEVQNYAGKVFFLLNKTDLLTAAEMAESIEFARSVLEQAMSGQSVALFPLSASQAKTARVNNDDVLLTQSGFPAFSEALEDFLMQEKGIALATALAKGLLRLVSQARFNTELALSSLDTPLEELRQKLAAFTAKRTEISQQKRDFEVLLKAEVRQLADTDVSVDVAAAKEKITQQVITELRRQFADNRHQPLAKLHETLRQSAMTAVRHGWDDFRVAEDSKLETAFQAITERFSKKIETAVDDLYRFSAELFSMSYDAVSAGSGWHNQSGFFYKFWEVPGSIVIMRTSLLHVLPKFIGDSLVLKTTLKYAEELTDTQAGRLRYDFTQRLDKSMNNFRKQMLERIDTTLKGIEVAVKKGLEVNAANRVDVQAQRVKLRSEMTQLAKLNDELELLMVAALI